VALEGNQNAREGKKPRFQAFGLLAVTDQPLGEELVRYIGNPNDTDVRDLGKKTIQWRRLGDKH
jgi:hypothetical protein